MQTADFNHNDFSNTAEADKALMVRFFYKNVQNKMESQKQGRPIFAEKTYIEIRIAGQRDAQACRPATHADKQRFAAHLEAFEKRVEPPTEGMPLIEWALMTRTQAEELSFLHIKTVEQLATVKDGNIQNFMGGYELRKKAIKWLETNATEVDDAEKAELRQDVAELKAQIKELLEGNKAQVEAQKEPVVLVHGLEKERELTGIELKALEGAAIPVPAAPAAKKARPRRNK